MKRVLSIVAWFFTFAFLGAICGMLMSITLYVAGFESASDYFDKKAWPVLVIIVMVLGLALGLYGFLPGTKPEVSGLQKPLLTNKVLKYLILRFSLGVLFVLATLPLVVAVLCFAKFAGVDWIGIPIGILYLFGIKWFVNKTSAHMVFDNYNIINAVKFTFIDVRLNLASLPLIGNWFISNSNEHNDKDSN
jgi:hypothetical protein